jgi:hypothetical protein
LARASGRARAHQTIWSSSAVAAAPHTLRRRGAIVRNELRPPAVETHRVAHGDGVQLGSRRNRLTEDAVELTGKAAQQGDALQPEQVAQRMLVDNGSGGTETLNDGRAVSPSTHLQRPHPSPARTERAAQNVVLDGLHTRPDRHDWRGCVGGQADQHHRFVEWLIGSPAVRRSLWRV